MFANIRHNTQRIFTQILQASKIVRNLCFIFLLLTTFTTFAKPVLKIQHWQTTHGVPVYFVRTTELPIVNIQVTFAAGSAYDGNVPGIAQFTSSMLDEGTDHLTADQLAERFESVGAQFSHDVSRDVASIGLRTLTKASAFNVALDTFTEALAHSVFPEKAFSRVKQQIISILNQQQQSPESIASDAFYKAIYGTHAYGHPTLGTINSVNAITLEQLRTFYSHYYVAKNTIVNIVGDMTENQAKTIAEQITKNLPIGESAPALASAKNMPFEETQTIRFPSEQTHILMGQIGIQPNDPDYFPLLVGNFILGGSQNSILFEQVRNAKGLAYSVGSAFVPALARGIFVISLQTRTDQAKTALQITQRVLQNFTAQGPKQQDLTAAKENLTGSFPLSLTSNDDISDNLSTISFYHLPLDYLDTYREKVNSVTVKQIHDAFKRHIDPKKMAVILVGKHET